MAEKITREVSVRADGHYAIWEWMVDPILKGQRLYDTAWRWVLVKVTPFEEVANASIL